MMVLLMTVMAAALITGMVMVMSTATVQGFDGDGVRKPVDGIAESPKKQMDGGVLPENVVCRAGMDLAIRTNGLAACITPETAKKMLDRGGMLLEVIVTDQSMHASDDDNDDDGSINDSSSIINKKNEQKGDGQKQQETGVASTNKAGADDGNSSTGTSQITGIPASGMSIINIYITDQDLNRARNSAETVLTEGLFEFTVGDVPIQGPQRMTETGPDTGVFLVRLQLPDTINGRPLSQDDVVIVRYIDGSDASGERSVSVKSLPLTNTFAEIQASENGARAQQDGKSNSAALVGREMAIRLYEPDANYDSRDEDKIPLSSLQFRGKGGIKTTLANPVFDANRPYLVETGPNTGMFEVNIEIPQEVDGRHIYTGDWYEITYVDMSTPSGTDEKIVMKGKIGR